MEVLEGISNSRIEGKVFDKMYISPDQEVMFKWLLDRLEEGQRMQQEQNRRMNMMQ